MNRVVKNPVSICFFCFIVAHCISANAGENQSADKYIESFPFSVGFDLKVLSDANVKDSKAAVEIWVMQLAGKHGFRTVSSIYNNISDIFKDLKDSRLDMVSSSALDYLRIAENLNTELAYGGIRFGKKTRKYILIVRSGVDPTDIKDLSGKKLALRMGDDVGLLFLNTLLLRNKKPEAEDFFSSIAEKKKFSQAVLSVFFGQTEACITTESAFSIMAELNPQVGQQLRIVATSPEVINTISFFRKDYSEKAKTTICNAALNMPRTADEKQLLLLFKLEKFFLLKDTDLDSLISLLDEYNSLKENIKLQTR